MPTRSVLHLLLILAAGVVTFVPFLDQTLEVSRHEIRHAEIAREIAGSGDFLIPTLLDEPYRDKPPVAAAAIAVLYRFAGEPSIGLARVPSAAAAVAGALALYVLGCTLSDRRTAFWAALGTLGVQGYQLMARTARPDMIFTLALLVSAAASVPALRHRRGRERIRSFAVAGASCAVATLIKGPLACAFCVLFPYAACAGRRDFRPPGVLDWLAFAAALAAAASLWVVPAYFRDQGDYLRLFLTQPDLTTWTLGDTLRRIHWPWMYSLVGLLPLTLLLWVLARDVRQRGLSSAAAIALGMLIVLSVIPKKRIQYQLPVYPFLALAVVEAKLRSSGRRWPVSSVHGLVLLSLAAGPLYFGAILPRIQPDEDPALSVPRRILEPLEPERRIVCLGRIAEAIAFVGRRSGVVQVKDDAELPRRLRQSAGAYLVLPAEREAIAQELRGSFAFTKVSEVRDGKEGWLVYRVDSDER